MEINNLILIGIVFLLLMLIGKWVLLLLLSPLIIAFNKKNRAEACKIENSDKRNVSGQINDDKVKNNSIFRIIKSNIRRYLEGYMRYMQFQVAYIPSHHIRNFIYKTIYLVEMEKDAIIYFGAEIRGGFNLSLGKGCIVGDKAVLDARRGGIEIGDNVQLGSFVKLWTGSHDHDDPYFRSMPNKRGPIKIGNRALAWSECDSSTFCDNWRRCCDCCWFSSYKRCRTFCDNGRYTSKEDRRTVS